ncbi:FxsB family cyclophane-forming radical SAM/SPASM peptide maturase [Streptomyces sp. NBC_00154]|uniref:FxsB family cyclophane-forming radical SAM/SPASM peptide maturase n=1 Tax=Streptomyces sp. NBC_00154 TaxID=2975670 RepID=UPI00224D8AD6|nr:FxsB family cyclophane-forming radical SAM/SPASM peptide maturase [Streptomyces sp. NBC_00154]MCX5318154.1 FxsB family radical SAM/SPASM domain protein [Streptomyces sp. NBC_00154]
MTAPAALVRADGVPFREFIVKVHSRCNIACDYCYMYEAADQSWRAQPMAISAVTITAFADRLAEHVREHALEAVGVVLHGGEPLLAGRDTLEDVVMTVRDAVSAEVKFSMQTNGVLLTEANLDLLSKHQVGIGVSLDGGPAHHDRHRRFANGRGSYDEVARGLRTLTAEAYRPLFMGLLATVDLANDPVEVYEALAAWEPPSIDLLLPHGTWDAPPPGHVPGETRYADWLISVFDHWYAQPEQPVRIRLFEELIAQLLGGTAYSEVFGTAPLDFVVVETDGTIELVDALKVAYDGAPATGLNVRDHSFDAVLEHPAMRANQAGEAALCETCRTCPLVKECGGGQFPHRYRTGTGFANPSVYCADLAKLISHVHSRLAADIARLTTAGSKT